MRYVKLPFGDQVHLVFDSEPARTVCGVSMDNAVDTEKPKDKRWCQNCDNEWRRRGRETQRPKKPKYSKPGTTYRPRNKFKDWEAEG